MKLVPTEPYLKAYQRLPERIQSQVDKQLEILLQNPRHPSLQVKKIKGIRGTAPIYEARITQRYRMTFQIQGEFYILRKVGPHSVLENP